MLVAVEMVWIPRTLPLNAIDPVMVTLVLRAVAALIWELSAQ